LNSEKRKWKHIFIEFWGKITVACHKKFQDLNINKSYFYKSDAIRRNGTLTEDVETKTDLMS